MTREAITPYTTTTLRIFSNNWDSSIVSQYRWIPNIGVRQKKKNYTATRELAEARRVWIGDEFQFSF